jgi:hypothetical protein
MTNYIQEAELRLKALLSGINANAADWTGQPVTAAQVSGMLSDLDKADTDVDKALHDLQEHRDNARKTATDANRLAGQIENLVQGIYASNPVKMVEYGVKERKSPQVRPVPGKATIKSIADDADGEGFVLERTSAADADNYEWQKATGTDPAVTNIDESKFAHYKTTKKVKFVDDDVKRGTRYFYRVRAVNASGNGPWSEAVSALQ